MAETAPPRRTALALLLPIALVSGVCSLTYEVVWVKQFLPIFGLGLYAVTTVVTSFMGGLILGSWLGGRAIDRVARPLRVYGFIELGIGACALLLPLAIDATSGLVPAFHRHVSDDFLVFSVFRFFVALALLAVPCSLMGATLPTLSRLLVDDDGETLSRDFSWLYAANVAGAVLGCGLAAFWLLEHQGVQATSRAVASVNLGLGGVCLWLARSETPRAAAAETPRAPRPPGQLLGLALFTGFFALSVEILWTRGLAAPLRDNVYVFPSILMVFLGGASGGSALAPLLLRRVDPVRLLSGLLVLAPLLVIGSFLTLSLPLDPTWFGRWAVFHGVTVLLVVLPASMVFGLAFPTIMAASTAGPDSVGSDVGHVVAANTLGSALGSFFTGFVFVPVLGMRNTVVVLCGGLLAVGLVHAWRDGGRSTRRPWPALVAAAGLLALGQAIVPDHLLRAPFFSHHDVDGEVVYYQEGLVSTVGVVRERVRRNVAHATLYEGGTKTFAEMDVTGRGRRSHLTRAHFPMLLHSGARRVLTIGLGTGHSTNSLLLWPELEVLDSVELSRETVEAAAFYDYDMDAMLADPRLDLVIDDGRNFLFTTEQTYDLVLVQTFGIKSGSHNVYFYTQDFLDLVAERLAPGGLMAVTLSTQTVGRDQDLLAVLVNTLTDRFPAGTLWHSSAMSGDSDEGIALSRARGNAFVLLGQRRRDLGMDAEALDARLQDAGPRVRAELATMGIETGEDVLKHLVYSPRGLGRIAARSDVVISDDKTHVDYRVAWQSMVRDPADAQSRK